MRMKRLSIMALLLAGAFVANAAETASGASSESKDSKDSKKEHTFYIDAQLRARGEVRGGFDPAAVTNKSAGFINERARLTLGYESKWLDLKFSGQHCGVWGQDAQVSTNSNFSIHEAWGKIKVAEQGYMQFGRQTLVYDDERILGGLDWKTPGRAHDALKLGYKSPDKAHQLDAVFAFNQSKEKLTGGYYFAGDQLYKNMYMLWYHFQSSGKNKFGLSFLSLNLAFENGTELLSKNRFLSTHGLYLTFKPGVFALDGSFYYQAGKTAAGKNISAWMAAFKGSAKVAKWFTPAIGADYLSGQNYSSGNYTVFNPLYGTHHKFYGLIDYFYVNGGTPAYGLFDPYLNLGFDPVKGFNVQLASHFFMTGNKFVPACATNEYLGTEIDLQLTYKLTKDISFMGGYSYLGGTQKLNNMNQHWGWLQVNVNPRIFTSKF